MTKNLKISIIMGIVCMILTVGICVQIKTVNNTSTGVGKTKAENDLRDSVLRWKERYQEIYNEENEKEKELEDLRKQMASLGSGSSEASEQITKSDMLLGYNEVKGEGIIVTVKDANSSLILGNPSDYVVHDGDLLEIVNALKNAGAEAISINNQRIVNTTAITCAGNIIKINGEKQGSPFEIKAIGLKEKIYGALKMPGGYLELLEDAGVQVKVERSDNIIIPKFDGVYDFKYAENYEK